MKPNHTTQPSVKSWFQFSPNTISFDLFTDSDFPADTTSIDGRTNQANSSSTEIKSFCCFCKVPCKIKHVSKDGPHQGRPFLSCAKSSNRCDFFQWDHGESSSSSSSQSLYWKRFSACDGWKFVSNCSSYSPEHILQG